jgi:hypothetical protein
MEARALFFSLAALICAGLAYSKSGWSMDELKHKVEDLGLMTESLKTRIAGTLSNAEKKIRHQGKNSDSTPVAE